MVNAQNSKTRQCIDKFKTNRFEQDSIFEWNKHRLNSLFGKLTTAQQGKCNQALDKLIMNKLRANARDALEFSDRQKKNLIKNRLLNRLVTAQKAKEQNCVDVLRENAALRKQKELSALKQRMRFLNYLISGSRGKMYCAIDRLRDHANELNGNDKLAVALRNMQEERRRKAAQFLCDNLAKACKAKEAECVRDLQEMNLAARQ